MYNNNYSRSCYTVNILAEHINLLSILISCMQICVSAAKVKLNWPSFLRVYKKLEEQQNTNDEKKTPIKRNRRTCTCLNK